MKNLKISTVQFENRSGDKEFNLSRISELAEKASQEGSRAVAFHECSITGYSFARKLSKEELLDLAEYVPEDHQFQDWSQLPGRATLLSWPAFLRETRLTGYSRPMFVSTEMALLQNFISFILSLILISLPEANTAYLISTDGNAGSLSATIIILLKT